MEIVLNKQLNTQILIDKYLLNIKKENPIEIFKNIFKIKFKNTIKYIGKEFNGKLKLKMIVEICLLFI